MKEVTLKQQILFVMDGKWDSMEKFGFVNSEGIRLTTDPYCEDKQRKSFHITGYRMIEIIKDKEYIAIRKKIPFYDSFSRIYGEKGKLLSKKLYTAYIDASVHQKKQKSSIGCILYNHKNEMIWQFSEQILYNSKPVQCELESLLELIKYIKNEGIYTLTVYTDCLDLLNIKNWKQIKRHLFPDFFLHLKWLPREKNIEAHELCRKPLYLN